MGFYADDYIHQLVLRADQQETPMEPWAIYDFGTREDWWALDGNVGTFPWWTGDDWQIRFVRPVSSLYLMGLHALFGEWAPGYHLAGLALFALLLVAVHGLYKHVGLSERAARIGTLLLAVCDSAVLPVGWTANNNSLLLAVFSVASMRQLLGGRPVIGLCLALGAAGSNEAGVVTLGLALLLCLGGRIKRARLFGALAFILCALYLAALVGGGYGTRSAFYALPWADPARFVGNLFTLVTAGSVSLLGPFPLDAASLFPLARWPLILFGCAIGLPIWMAILRTVRGKPGVIGFGVWCLAFLLPHAGTLPADRLLFLPSIGAIGILATYFEEKSGLRQCGPRMLWWFATVGSGLYLLIQGVGLSAGAAYLRESAPRTEVGSPEIGHRDIFVLQAESQFQAFTLHSMWAFHTSDRDLTFWNLQNGRRALLWIRVDERTFDIQSLDRPFLTGAFERVYLARSPAFKVGDTWSTREFAVEALEVENGYPVRLRFRMGTSLDDPSLRFVRSSEGRLVRVAPPALGASIQLEAPVRFGPFMP